MAGAYHLRIRSSRGFAGFNLRELWDFRGLLAALAIRDIKLRYRQTALGVAWVALQPLLAFVFGTVAGIIKPGRSSAFVFVLGGFIGWSLFSAGACCAKAISEGWKWLTRYSCQHSLWCLGCSFFGVPNENLRMSCRVGRDCR